MWICEELAEAGPALSASFHAGFVRRNCAVDLFKRRREEWNVHQLALIKDQKARKSSRSSSSRCKDGEGGVTTAKGGGGMDEIDDIFAAKK